MSNRNAVAVVHGPVKLEQPRIGHLLYGVVLPATVLAIELASRLCAETFFDPIPTWWHVAMVALVPASNLVLFLCLSEKRGAPPRALLMLSGATIAIAGFYALIFLPLLPIALVAVLIGIGILPLAPYGGLIAAWQLRTLLRARTHPVLIGGLPLGQPRYRFALWSGVGLGLLALLVLDARVAITRLGTEMAQSQDPVTRARGVALLRSFGDENQLLRYCYDSTGRPEGLATAILMLAEQPRQRFLSPASARETYYLVTGRPYNAEPAPSRGLRSAPRDRFAWDRDQGGTQVAGRVNGLSLASSRIDGSISGDDAVAYLEWTLEVANASPMQREMRMELALPPGGVVSRATLWVNGEEREAAFASRDAVRKAYENIVRRLQDPLLVTTRGADRVLAQAFPIPPNGGKMKIRLGITAPLDLASAAEGRLVLPAILDRNFAIEDASPHAVWIESKSRVIVAGSGLAAEPAAKGYARVSGSLPDNGLSGKRVLLTIARDVHASVRTAQLRDNPEVKQEIISASSVTPALMIVVDGSVRVSNHIGGLIAALDAIPDGRRIGLVLAGDTPVIVPVAPWARAQADAFRSALQTAGYSGGADNTDAIVAALKAMEAIPGGRILWVHGPQPVAFASSRPRLEQATSRLGRLAPLSLYAVEPGPNQLLNDGPWAWSAQTVPVVAGIEKDLTQYLGRELGGAERPVIVRIAGSEVATEAASGWSDLPRGSEHIARLWARDAIIASALAKPAGDRTDAVKLAADYQLVTPVSGAVVLENARQYQEAGLTPVAAGTVPTVPEPHEWALLILVLAMLTWALRQRMAGEAR